MKKYFKNLMAMAIAIVVGIAANAQITISNNSSSTTLYQINTAGAFTFTALGASATLPATVGMNWSTTVGSTSGTAIADLICSTPVGAVGTVTYTWTVLGDLQIGGTSVQTATATTTQTNTTPTAVLINNWNSNNRYSGSNLYDQGQGKGRVMVTATWTVYDTNCTTHMVQPIPVSVSTYVDIYKILGPVTNLNGTQSGGTSANQIPPVVGPTCLKPTTKYTWSVDPDLTDDIPAGIAVDRFLWSANSSNVATIFGTGAAINYYSADSSEITITTGSTIPASPSLSCSFGICNFPSPFNNVAGVATSTLTLQQAVAAPTIGVTGSGGTTVSVASFTSYPGAECVSTNAITPFTNNITLAVTPVAGYTYSWAWSGVAWTSTAGSQPVVASSLPLTLDNNPGYVTLTSTGPCGDVRQDVININRTYTSAMFTLPTCNTEGSPIVLTIAGGASSGGGLAANDGFAATGFTATNNYSGTATTSPGAGTVSYTSPTAPGNTYTVSVANACTSTLNYSAIVKPASLTTNSPVCVAPSVSSGGPITVSVPSSICSGCSFAWGTYTGTGVTANTPAALSSTLTTTAAPTTGTFTGTYTVATGCYTSSAVTVNITPSAPTITPPSCVNYNTVGTYSFHSSTVSGATSYTWSCSVAGYTVPSGQGTTTASIDVPATTSNYTVSCVVATPCGNVTATSSISVSPLVAGESVGDATVGSQTFYALNITPSGSPAYSWTESGVVVGTGTTYTGTTLNTAGINVCCTLTPSGGCSSTWCTTTPGTYRKLPGTNPGKGDLGALINLYPNPNKGQFTLSLPEFNESANLIVIDMEGKEVMRTSLTQGDNLISDGRITSGSYTLMIFVDGVSTAKSIVVTK